MNTITNTTLISMLIRIPLLIYIRILMLIFKLIKKNTNTKIIHIIGNNPRTGANININTSIHIDTNIKHNIRIHMIINTTTRNIADVCINTN